MKETQSAQLYWLPGPPREVEQEILFQHREARRRIVIRTIGREVPGAGHFVLMPEEGEHPAESETETEGDQARVDASASRRSE